MWINKQQLELDMEQLTGSPLGKKYNKAIYCHPAYLTYMQSCCCLVTKSYITLCDPMDCSLPGSSAHGDSAGQNTGVGTRSLLQGIFLTQELNQGLLNCRRILYQWNYQESPLWLYRPLSAKWCLFFLIHSRFLIAFLPRRNSKVCLLISWLQSLSTVILEQKKTNVTVSTFPPSICNDVMGSDAMILVLLRFKPAFFHSLLSFSSRYSLVPPHFLTLEW